MPTLKELLGIGEKRQTVIEDACNVIDSEVAAKGGLTGAAIKAAYGVVKNIKPGFIREAVDALLDEFLERVDPVYQEAVQQGVSPAEHLRSNAGRVADQLLSVTDTRAERSEKAVIKKTYAKLRPTAKKHVESAIPRVAELIERQLA